MTIDTRLDAIKIWLSQYYTNDRFSIVPASSDASFRRYFRVTSHGESLIVMDAPVQYEDTKPFIKVAQFLSQHQLHVPQILAQEPEQGFLLLTDLGSRPYLDRLNNQSADTLYADAIKALIDIQLCDQQSINLPVYNRALLQQELQLFPEWFLERHLSISAPKSLQNQFELLIDNALEQPQVVVHRDYHSRNLMYSDTNNPGIIDFQDAVIGPISYDLVSLLRDCYIAWPDNKIQYWVEQYFTLAQQRGLLTNCKPEQFIRWFDLMGLQRHIKVLGIFCRLRYRDNKTNYIADLPQTLAYVQQVCAKYDEFKDLSTFLSSQPKIMAIL
tara:strand:+ start:276 stop:1259 length:984 start_codon:yes stop_codon:yes gene_type:complete